MWQFSLVGVTRAHGFSQLTTLTVTGPVAATGTGDVKIEQGSNQLVLFVRATLAEFSAESCERALTLEE